jgi:hypothetical protein
MANLSQDYQYDMFIFLKKFLTPTVEFCTIIILKRTACT